MSGPAGYEALREAVAWLDLSARGKIRATGADRARLLHAISTNHIQQLTPGKGCYAFFLNAQGRVLGDAHIFCFEDHFLLDTEPETHEKLREHIDRYIIADDCTVEDVTAGIATIAVEGPKAKDVLSGLGAPLAEEPYATARWGEWIVANAGYTGGLGHFLFGPPERKPELVQQLEAAGVVAASEDAFRIVRLEHGKPRYGEDITERFLAQETQQMHALHFNKGCYLGQEIVERVRSRALLHRVLMPVHLDIDTPPPPGTKLQADGKDVAEITSALYSPGLGKTVALAYVRTEHARPGSVLNWGTVKAEVQP